MRDTSARASPDRCPVRKPVPACGFAACAAAAHRAASGARRPSSAKPRRRNAGCASGHAPAPLLRTAAARRSRDLRRTPHGSRKCPDRRTPSTAGSATRCTLPGSVHRVALPAVDGVRRSGHFRDPCGVRRKSRDRRAAAVRRSGAGACPEAHPAFRRRGFADDGLRAPLAARWAAAAHAAKPHAGTGFRTGHRSGDARALVSRIAGAGSAAVSVGDAAGASLRRDEWLFTPRGDARGYIQPHTLSELWFHTGTACNLACPFCLEGSRPGDRRLGRVTFADLQPFIDEAVQLGVRQFSFTGGEPFLIKDLVRILSYALERAPCLVLTNGVDAVPKRLAKLAELRARPHALALRVSIDYPERARHDAGRGAGNFLKAWAALALLHGAGFRVSIARQMEPGENRSAVEDAYRRLMCAHALPQDLTIVAFPDFGAPGTQPPEVGKRHDVQILRQ